MTWYVVAGLIVGALLVYSFVTSNYIFAVLVLMTMIVLFSHHVATPQELTCHINSDGVQVGEKAYRFGELESFWIIKNELGQRVLYIKRRSTINPPLPIPMPYQHESDVKNFLRVFLVEEDDVINEPLMEWLARKLKL